MMILRKGLPGLSDSVGVSGVNRISESLGSKPTSEKIKEAIGKMSSLRPEYRKIGEDRHTVEEIIKRLWRTDKENLNDSLL